MDSNIPVLVISGAVGVGKSTVLNEIHDVLSEAAVPHACVERDALAMSWPEHGPFNQLLVHTNLAKVTSTFRAAGATRMVIAGVVETSDDIERIRQSIPGADITLCRLVAPQPVREARLRQREPGAAREWHLHRTVELDQILDAVRLEQFTVENGDRAVRDVALDVLRGADWWPVS